MSLRYEVIPSTNGSMICVQTDLVHEVGGETVRETLTRQLIDAQDATLRASLIQLGWTPPPETAARPAGV